MPIDLERAKHLFDEGEVQESESKRLLDEALQRYRDGTEILDAWLNEDPTNTQEKAAAFLGRTQAWVSRLCSWKKRNYEGHPFADASGQVLPSKRSADVRRTIREHPEVVVPEIARALRKPEIAEQVVPAMSARAASRLANVVGRVEQERKEHAASNGQDEESEEDVAESIANEAQPDQEPIQPDPCDERLHALERAIDRLDKHAKQHGVVLRSLTQEQALTILQNAEQVIGEVRAMLQEQMDSQEVATA